MPSTRTAVILLAAGDGRRVGGETNKVLLPLAGLPVFGWSLRAITRLNTRTDVVRVVVVVRDQDRAMVDQTLAAHFPALDAVVVTGGTSRHGSEWNALSVLTDGIEAGTIDVVAIHDAARPLAGAGLFAEVIEVARRTGGALPVREQACLVHREQAGALHGRQVAVQTPQAFRAPTLLAAYQQADRAGFVGTDTASCIERYTELRIRCVAADAGNLKITFPEDVTVAERLLVRGSPT